MPNQDFEERVALLARGRLGGEMSNLRRLTGGASKELWSFDVRSRSGPRGYVLRRAPAVEVTDALPIIELEAEATVIRAVGEAGVPVPEVAHVLSPEDNLGSGFVARRVDGEALGRRVVSAPEFATARSHLAANVGEILARLHSTPIDGLHCLRRYSPEESIDMLETQLRSWDEPRPVFELAIRWLRGNCPPLVEEALVHGDFRTGNYLLMPSGISAVLDWEGAHIGDPMEDLAWFCMPTWRFGRNDRPAGGVGQRDELYAGYEAMSAHTVDRARVRFWEVRGMLRWGITCMFMADSFLRGEGNLEWAAVGRRASEAEAELLHALYPENPHA